MCVYFLRYVLIAEDSSIIEDYVFSDSEQHARFCRAAVDFRIATTATATKLLSATNACISVLERSISWARWAVSLVFVA